MNKQDQTLRFCHALLRYGVNRCHMMANFVMSLASSPSVSHSVELSASPFCHYYYSNLTKVLKYWQVGERNFRSFIRCFLSPLRLFETGVRYYALTHDVTKLLKKHSPCLKDRQFVPTSNNVIASNRALGVGCLVSAQYIETEHGGWCPPLTLKPLGLQEGANAVAVKQIKSLVQDNALPFGEELCLLLADSSYVKTIFLSPLYDLNEFLILRLRPDMKVWAQPSDADPSGGAKRVYGNKFYFTDTSGW